MPLFENTFVLLKMPQLCFKEMAVYHQDLLKIRSIKDVPWTMQERRQATSKTQCITETCQGTNTLSIFFSFFLIRVIFILLAVFSIGFMVAGWSCAQTRTLTYTPQMSTGACSDADFFPSSPFFHSSGENNKHQQPDIISIGEDKEDLLMTTNISAVDFCVCNWRGGGDQ